MKSNSEYSWLYDPLYTLKTTLGGQLALIMLSEMLVKNVKDITVLQINTDGITAIIPRTEKRNFYNQCVAWEGKTKLQLEYQSYKQMIIRDVNSYIAESTNGYVKYKGIFKPYNEMIKDNEYHKSMSQMIVPTALSEYFLNGTPIEETIMNCDNIFQFTKTFNATRGWTCETEQNGVIIERSKTNRYIISPDGEVFRKLKYDDEKGLRSIEVEAGGKKVTILNHIDKNSKISDYNIDYDYYINECYKIIHKIDGTEERLIREKKERKEKEKLEKQEQMFIKYCIDKKPTVKQLERYGKDWLIDKYGLPETR